MRRIAAVLSLVLLAAACGRRDDLSVTPEPIGDFYLGHNIAVAVDPERGPFSREATNEDWEAAMKQAVADRFSRFDGDHFYHIAVSIDGYVLAMPGVPLVYTPKSVLIFSVTFYDDETQAKINEEPIQLTVFEACCSTPFIGSGLSKSAEEQMEALAFNAARAIERAMRENGTWFQGVAEVLPEDDTIIEGLPPTEGAAPAEPAEPAN